MNTYVCSDQGVDYGLDYGICTLTTRPVGDETATLMLDQGVDQCLDYSTCRLPQGQWGTRQRYSCPCIIVDNVVAQIRVQIRVQAYHKAGGGRDSDTHVDVVAVDNVVAIDDCVHRRNLFQRLRRRCVMKYIYTFLYIYVCLSLSLSLSLSLYIYIYII